MRRLVIGSTVAALTGLLVLIGAAGASASASAGAATPYRDANATSSLTLCGKDGEPVSSGFVGQRPFVWRAVSSSAAPAPYDGSGRTATLFAYQPRPQVDPGEWSGDLLTASAKYSNAAHPMAVATKYDEPLSDFLDEFPTRVDGLVQLRLYLGVPRQPAYTLKYAAATIRVTGDTWQVVGSPAKANCTSGTAVSLESILPTSVTKKLPTANAAPATKPGATASTSKAASDVDQSVTAAAPVGTSLASSEERPGSELVLPVLAFLLAAGSVTWWLFRRHGKGDR
jgi:hypothetical protein